MDKQNITSKEAEKFTIRLYENPLTDDMMTVLNEGYAYKGHNRASVKIVWYSYANEWGDHEHELYARTIEGAIAKYQKVKGIKVDEDTLEDIEILNGDRY